MSGDGQSVSLSIDLDDDFQKFLEEPLSSDDTDGQLSSQQQKKLWWLDSENETGTKHLAESPWLKKPTESAKNHDSLAEKRISSEKSAGHSWLKKPSTEKSKSDEKARDASLEITTVNAEKSAGDSLLKKLPSEESKCDDKDSDVSRAKTSINNEVKEEMLMKISESKDATEGPASIAKEEEVQSVEENVVSSADEISEIPTGSLSTDKEINIMDKHVTVAESLIEDHYSDATFDSDATKSNENKSIASHSSSETCKNTLQEETVASDVKSDKDIAAQIDVLSLTLPEKSTDEATSKPENLVSENKELSLKEIVYINNIDENATKDITTKETDVEADKAEEPSEGNIQISKQKKEATHYIEEISIKCKESPTKEKRKEERRKISNSSLVPQSSNKEKPERIDLKNDVSIQTTFSRERDTLDKLSESQQVYLEEQKKSSKLKAELISLEKEMKRKLEEQRLRLEQNCYCLQQDNIILTARIEEMELQQLTPSSKSHCDEEISSLKHYRNQLEKELKEQEHLLQGYQQENERLYSELKSVKKEFKLNEGKFRNRMEELTAELSRVKEQLRLRERANHFRLSEIGSYKEENSASENLQQLSNQTLHIDQATAKVPTKEEIESLKNLLSSQHEEIQNLLRDKDEFTREVNELSKKLAATSINSDHLSRQEEEITKLNDHITILEKERLVEKKSYMQVQIKDHKRIKELENEIRNMELCTRKQPRSPGKHTAGKDKQDDTDTIKYLKEEIQKLNRQLEMKDQLAKKSLLEIEAQYKDIKDEYEKRLKAIELQYCNQISMLENKLSNIEVLPHQISHSASDHQNINKIKLSKASQCTLDIERVEYFTLENKELKQKLNKMALEMEAMKEECKKSKDEANQIVTSAQKEALDMISQMKSEMDDLKTEHEKSEERARTLIKNAQKEAQEMARQLKVLHVKELQLAYSDIATSHVHTNDDILSRAADLLNKVETRDIIISQLEQKLKQMEKDNEKILILEMKNSSLENQIKELKTALNQIQNRQTPHEKEFWALKEEIEGLERRHIEREEAIQKMLYKLKQQDSKYLKNEITKWQQRVIDKNKEIEFFRSELDVIVRCLKELKLQGITIPRPNSVT